MNILIIRNAFKKDTGGAEQYSYNLAYALKKLGHSPILVTNQLAIQNRCKTENIRFINGIWNNSQEWSKVYYIRKILMPLWYMYLILRFKIDIVTPQSRDDFIFANIASNRLGKPCYWMDHADLKYIMDRVNLPHPRMQEWILNQGLKATKIIASSESEYKLILDVAPEFKDKLELIHNGVFKPLPIKIKKHTNLIIGTNSRLVETKGIGELITGFASMSKKYDGLELWLLGGESGNKSTYLELTRKLGIEKHVKFLGYKKNPHSYVASMDIFVHPSYHEAFSLAIIEACMLARPIIATNVGGTPEIITPKTGLLIPAKNVKAIEAALETFILNPVMRDKLGKAAQKLANDKYDFMNIVKNNIIPLYEGGRN